MYFLLKVVLDNESLMHCQESASEQLQEGDMEMQQQPDVCIEDQVQVRGQSF